MSEQTGALRWSMSKKIKPKKHLKTNFFYSICGFLTHNKQSADFSLMKTF